MTDFRLLGPMAATHDGTDVLPARSQQRALLAVLLLHANAVVTTDQLVEALWGSEPPASAHNALQGHVSALRKRLGADRIETRPPGYVLHVEPAELDITRFEQLLEQARNAAEPERRAALARDALALFRGEPLSDFRYERFAESEIARLEELRLAACEERIEAELALGGRAELVAELEQLVATHPLRERLRELLMLALYRSGRQADALEVFRQTRELLVDELGIEPGPGLQDVNRAILSHDPALRQERAARSPLEPRALPAPAHPLVDRHEEIASLRQLLLGDARLVTVSGAGGSGKTRLALELARLLQPEFEGRVSFVALAPLSDPGLVSSAIAAELGVRESSGQPVPETITAAIGRERVLLVLDNFEHVLDASPLAAELLAACAGLRIVVTSRSPLHVSGEHEFPLDPLPADEAVELFSQRARAARPGFTAAPETLSRICERLEGLPLALELAAARTKVLSPDELLARLHQRLDLLAAGPRDLPERQQTLRAAIQWSYELLHADEQALFMRLAVFAGGCTLESAEAVCGASLDSLTSLIDKSLVRRGDSVSGSSRFWMLETIREFAQEQLTASGEEPDARRAHAAYFVTLAEDARARLSGAGQREALEQVDAELDNLRAALAWTYDAAPADAVRLAAALGRCWAIRGQMQEAHRWLEAIALLPEVESPPGATALLAAGNFASYAGDLEEARGFYERGRKIAQAVVPSQVPNFLVGLGQIALSGGDVATARKHWEKALAGARKNGDDATAALILNNLGWAAIEEDDLDAATVFLDQSAEIQREIGDGANLAMMLSALAYVRFKQGNRTEGQDLLCEAVTLAIESGDRPATAWCVVVAAFGVARESPEQAARLLGAAEAASMQFGVPPEQFDAKVRGQAAAQARGRLDEGPWQAAWDSGMNTSLEAAASIVLKSPAVDQPRRSAKGRRA